MKFNCVYWGSKTRIEMLQRWILVHSVLYYEMNTTIVNDSRYDNNCVQLVGLKDKFPSSYEEAKYSYCMPDFDGNSGFGLYDKLNAKHKEVILRDARYLLGRYRSIGG